ncbi:MAG: 3-hydroxyacyl-CoA dehydrogenase NAD-binding domain-containing protein [Alphaproteobacteria bacterium]|jgi:3-hydroxyacyl-CoA dehydrogenase|nr:3-hydroxyacyl-CoA dehydrogenase NAD-binding domain-containing protein [Alphaproteobacteria bacterium]
MAEPVTLQKQGSIGVITVDNPPVNALSAGVRDGLLACLNQGLADDEIKAMVLLGKDRTFIAGADIREFGKPRAGVPLHEVNEAYEFADKPVVAAIHGTALGGGLEIALCCHYRYAVPSAQVGLPEVKLGLLPGAGGTQRLPRIVGAETALDLIANGSFVPAAKAKELGIVDEVGDELLEGAVAYAERLVAEGAPRKRIRDLDCSADASVFEAFRKSIQRSARGFKAPWACVDAVEAAATLDFEAGLAREGELFKELHDSAESAAQRHVFFSEREVAKIPDVPRGTATKKIAKGAVIGAGTMGGGIAMNFANAGIPVTVLEMSQEALDKGLATVTRNYQNTVNRGRLAQAKMDERLGLISTTTSYDDIADADIVIEAVFEEMEIKKQVFAKLDEVAKADAVLASNTSTLDIDQMAEATKRPAQVIGMHFFSPANVMRLLEVVRGAASSPETIATAMGLGRAMGKVSVLVGNCHGFVGNRMLHGYSRQGAFLLEEGALPQQVDKVVYDFGLPMGPFTMGDMAGLDIGWRIRKAQAAERPSNRRYSPIADKICEMGRFGQKTGAGYYRYEAGDRTPIPDPEIEKLIVETSAELGIERREISDDEILKRCLYPLINIGAQILDEGMALRASDIDIIYIYGYGFPAYRGGPMFWADQTGLDKVLADIQAFHAEHGEDWAPAPLLERLVAEGKSFADYKG